MRATHDGPSKVRRDNRPGSGDGPIPWRVPALRVSGLDPRSVALFRIVTGIVLILDVLVFKMPNVANLYGPAGFFKDVYATQASSGRPFYLNIFYHLGSDTAVYAYFAGCCLVYAAHAVGYRPRVFTVLSCLLFALTIASNKLLRLTPDGLLLYALFWGAFLPLDARFSVRGRAEPSTDGEIRSMAAFVVLAAVCIVYFTNGYNKLGGDWLTGRALLSIVGQPATRGPLSAWLLEQDVHWLAALEYLTVGFEVGLPLLVFLPYYNGQLRVLAAASIFLFHYGTLLFLSPGFYYAVGTCFAVLLLPAGFWNALARMGGRVDGVGAGSAPGDGTSRRTNGAETSERVTAGKPRERAIDGTEHRRIVSWGRLLRNLSLLLCMLPVILVNLTGSGQRVIDVYNRIELTVPQMDLLSFLFMKHVYYGRTVSDRRKNLVVMGLTSDGRLFDLATGREGAVVELSNRPPYFRRPYYAIHRGLMGIWRTDAFVRLGVADRWLDEMVRRWHARHPDLRLQEARLITVTWVPGREADAEYSRKATWRSSGNEP